METGMVGAEAQVIDAVVASPDDQVEAAVVRDLILQAYVDVVPEMIIGETVEEMMASIPLAQAAYQRLAEAFKVVSPVMSAPPMVPAGGAMRVYDPAGLPSVEKIRRGVGQRHSG